MFDLEALRAAWEGNFGPSAQLAPSWPQTGIAVEGDFSGIQRFVMRPVPGAAGAARRLRARSFRVLSLTRLVAEAVKDRFKASQPLLFYSAGGRFLIVMHLSSDWQQSLSNLQAELDKDLLSQYHGELIFHLAGAEFSDRKIPVSQLRQAMHLRRKTPLANALQSDTSWTSSQFFFPALSAGKCDGCGTTDTLSGTDEKLCQTCMDDRELGRAIMSGGNSSLAKSDAGSLCLLGQHWKLVTNGEVQVPVVSHAPLCAGQLATFQDLAKRSAGRQYLAYLRIDADQIGAAFRSLDGNPVRTFGLSRLLDLAFSSEISKLISSDFPDLYPVYGGGDDFFVIGPWNQTLGFAAAWHTRFRALSKDKLTFSAGFALAKPRQHILTKSEEAEHALNKHAKATRDSIHALGCTIPWRVFLAVLEGARHLLALRTENQVPSAFLNNLMELHRRWQTGDPRWHSMLFYQTERNLTGAARDWVRRELLSQGDLWLYANFITRYVMLSSSSEKN